MTLMYRRAVPWCRRQTLNLNRSSNGGSKPPPYDIDIHPTAEWNWKFNKRLLTHRCGGPPSLARECKEVKAFRRYVAVDLSHVNTTK